MKNKLSRLVTIDDVKLFFIGWKFSDYFIYGLTIFLAAVAGYVAGVN